MVNGETDVTLIVGAKSFDNPNVGTRTVTASSLTLGGADAGNYVLATNVTATDQADISAKALTVTATGPTKEYGTALTAGTSTTNFSSSGAISGEAVTGVTLTPDAAGLSATTAAGAAYVVTPSLATGTGGFLESNYSVTYNPYNGIVSAKALTVTATGPTKDMVLL